MRISALTAHFTCIDLASDQKGHGKGAGFLFEIKQTCVVVLSPGSIILHTSHSPRERKKIFLKIIYETFSVRINPDASNEYQNKE